VSAAAAERGIARTSGRLQASRPHDRGLARAFAATSASYALIFPAVARELATWRRQAAAIPDATLRHLALASLAKRGNMEGAALFAVLAPRPRRREALRALVVFQAAYNYVDLLAERPSADPARNGRELHGALLAALDPTAPRRDHYAYHPQREDGGYLAALVETSRATLARLPSYRLVAGAALTAAARIVEFQSLNLGERQGSCDGLERWARTQTPAAGGLRWWELAGACGSSLSVHALIGLAARGALDVQQVAAVAEAYHPSVGALHSLLDSLVDVEEDRRERLRNLVVHYGSAEEAGERMAQLAARSRACVRSLADGDRHETIVTAMLGYYLSAPSASDPGGGSIAAAVLDGAGPPLSRTLPLFRGARVASRLVRTQR
jgi:tetraprenyl-beta-curcumene synthase